MSHHKSGPGSVYFDRSKQLYYAAVSIPGAGQRKSRGFHDEAAARLELGHLQRSQHGQDDPVSDPLADVSLGDYGLRWIQARRVLGQLRPLTAERFAGNFTIHIAADPIGRVPLRRVSSAMLADFILRKLTTPRPGSRQPRGAPLAAATVHRLHSLLTSICKAAQRDGLVERNPMESVSAPGAPAISTDSTRTSPLSSAQYQYLQELCDRTRLGPLALFCAATGLRMGEALGLERADVHLDGPVPHVIVRQQLQHLQAEDAARRPQFYADGPVLRGWALRKPKSRHSLRLVGLPHDAQRALRRMLELVDTERQADRDRQAWGPSHYGQVYDRRIDAWVPVRWLGPPLGSGAPQRGGLVFCSERGTPLFGSDVLQRFKRAMQAAGLPQSAFHALRHTNATLLSSGVPTALLRDHIGHSTIEQTLTYAHDLSLERAALTSVAFDRAVGGFG